MHMQVTILGSNSAISAFGRHPSAQYLHIGNEGILIDCGEGTQTRLAPYGVKRGKIKHIFISHLHGDHYYGLMGLLTSYNLLGRSDALHIYAPAALEGVIQAQLQASDTALRFPLHFHALEEGQRQIPLSTQQFEVQAFPLEHRIPCFGFKFQQKIGNRKIDMALLEGFDLQGPDLKQLQLGFDVILPDGRTLPNHRYTLSPPAPRSYAYVTDTLALDNHLDILKGTTLLYHEATFLAADTERALSTFHSTTHQAAAIAQKAGVQQLLIGHFSSRYEDLSPYINETSAKFANTKLALEGLTIDISRL